MNVFVDTSALYALLDEDDEQHDRAKVAFNTLRDRRELLVTHAYVVVETLALVQARLGRSIVARLVEGILPVVESRPVSADLHYRALAAYLADEGDRSFVDWTSFTFARDEGIDAAFAFDADFERQRFSLV